MLYTYGVFGSLTIDLMQASIMNTLLKILLPFAFILVLQAPAYAQNCNDLDQNTTWTDGIQYVRNAVETKSWESALEKARELVQICPTSPLLNYYVSMALDAKGDKIKSLQYIKKASENTFLMATSPEAARLIWYARHDAEYPERTEQAIAEMKQSRRDQSEKTSELIDARHDDLAIGLWTGVSFAAAGIGLTIAGGILAFRDDDYIDPNSSHAYYDGKDIYIRGKTTVIYQAGLTMFGAGIAALVSGTLLTAIFGYKYTHIRNDHAATVSFSPQHISFSMNF